MRSANFNEEIIFHWAKGACLLIILCFLSCEGPPEVIEPRNMEVLFLGHDHDHHNGKEYLPYLASSLAPLGINFSFTSDLRDLKEANLSQYDALMIYANHDEIKGSHEKALLNYVKKGGGLLPIHSASYCFRNSDEYVDLVGGQFESHDTGTFELEIVDASHPITEGFESFSTWDETYVHTKHSKKHVLMERVEGAAREPYTWVKTYGKGRIFYTALGHDLRTWSQPQFHDLIFRGIRWAIGENKAEALSQLDIPKLAYSDAKIPNYEKRDPSPRLQAPLTPEESMKLIQVPPEFELSLFASEPDIVNPIAMNWDEKGRLWVLETIDYPNEIKVEDEVGNDRIQILEDTDGDGKADKFTVFAENLSVPTSIVFHDGGVIVSQAPYFLFLKDTDGDDKADVREIIMEGWGTFDTHAGPSNLRYGFDNKIWGVVGYSGFEGNPGGVDHKFSQGIYRFKPDGSSLEFISKTSNNTWGLGFTEDFDVFISTANNTHSGYHGIPDLHLRGVDGIHMRGVAKIDGHYLFHPITRNFRQVDVFGGFTAAAGHSFYTARSFPEEYWNKVAFVSEPTGHLLHRAILKRDGAGYEEEDGWNLLASADEWVSPVAAEVGPDGAVWVLDWYNFIIQHNPTPPGFDNGAGNAHINPLRDKARGRIYRIGHKKAPQYETISLDSDDPNTLVATLSHDNLLWRMHAQRLLVERGNGDVKSELIGLVANNSKDALGLNNAALHAIWTLDGLGLVSEENTDVFTAVEGALRHEAAGVRKAALMVLPNESSSFELISSAGLFHDPHPQTRLAALNKLWHMPSTEDVSNLLVQLAKDEDVLRDLWLSRSVYLAAVKHKDDFIKGLVKDNPDIFMERSTAVNPRPIDYKSPGTNTDNWDDIPVPRWLNHTNIEELTGFTGIIWYRKDVLLNRGMLGSSLTLHIPGAANRDVTYFNGVEIGKGSGWDQAREYKIPPSLIRSGQNHIAIRLEAGGGIGFGDPDDLMLRSRRERIPLAGTWKYKIEKLISSNRSEYADGDDIIGVFLKNYGPYASKLVDNLERSQAIVDKIIMIRTIKDQMKYDVTEIKAEPGEILEIVFQNNDAMQHNLLVLEPGTLRQVGNEAERLARERLAAEMDYVPDLDAVLYNTPLLNPGEEYRLRFKVPDESGDYPYVCTFPGHWQTMNGVLKVGKPGI